MKDIIQNQLAQIAMSSISARSQLIKKHCETVDKFMTKVLHEISLKETEVKNLQSELQENTSEDNNLKCKMYLKNCHYKLNTLNQSLKYLNSL